MVVHSILLLDPIFSLHIDMSHPPGFSDKTHQALGYVLDLVVLV